MARTKGAKNAVARITDSDIQEMKKLRSLGMGLSDIGKRYGLGRDSVRNIIAGSRGKKSQQPTRDKAAGEDPGETQEGGPPPQERNNAAPAEAPMADSTETKVAMLERDLAEVRDQLSAGAKNQDVLLERIGEISKQLQVITRKPLDMKKEGDQLDVSCPNCGTSGAYQLPKVTPKSDEILGAYFEQPHEGGSNAFECKTCGPKLEQYAEQAGYRLVKK